MELKHLCKLYDRRVQYALIPFYLNKIEALDEDIDNKRGQGEGAAADLKYLKKMREHLKQEKDQERDLLKNNAQKIYDLWKDILTIRDTTKLNYS